MEIHSFHADLCSYKEALPVELSFSFNFTPFEVDLIFDMVNSNHFVKNRVNNATVIVENKFEGKYFVNLCYLFSLHRLI